MGKKPRRGMISTKEFLDALLSFGVEVSQYENGYKFLNPKTKQTSNIHAHRKSHELNPSVIKKTVNWLGIDYSEFERRVLDL